MKEDQYLLSSVNNTLQLLDVLSRYQALSLAEMAKLVSFDKASIFRMMYTLEKNGYVQKDDQARYSLGIKFLQYGGIVSSRQSMIRTASSYMQRFCQETGMSAHLGLLSGNRIVTVHIEDPMFDIQVSARVGMSAPAYSTAMGRAILANLPFNELDALCDHFTFKRYSDKSILSMQQLMDTLQQVRDLGYASDIDDRFPGFGALGMPVFNAAGRCIAAVSFITLSRNLENGFDELLPPLKKMAEDISAALGAVSC